jgi:hypothetical protein
MSIQRVQRARSAVCANCVLMSDHDAVTAAVMGASAPDKSAIVGKAPSKPYCTITSFPGTQSVTVTAGDWQPETPNTATKFQERAHCTLERFRNRGSSAISSVCLRGKRRSRFVYVESPVNAIPKRSHANATQKFQRFPRFPLVTPWTLVKLVSIAQPVNRPLPPLGCSDASIRESAAMCLECLRHNSPSTSLWLPLRPGKSRRATVPSALAHSKKGLTR